MGNSRVEKLMTGPIGYSFFLLVFSVCIILSSFFYINQEAVRNALLSGDNSITRLLHTPSKELVSGDDENGECDWYEGHWVWDEMYPLYESKDCKIMETTFRCQENGRANATYTKWRWQPKECDLPRFNAEVMLEKLRNRRVVFVGDSTARNQWESLMCLLSTAVSNQSSIYEVNGLPVSKSEGYLVVKFEEYNCTLEYSVAPFLVHHKINPPRGSPEFVTKAIKLDRILPVSTRWKDADILIFNSGHWWTDASTKHKGMYYQHGDEVKTNMTHEFAYQLAIKTLISWVETEVNLTNTHVFLRTFGPKHFSGGDWNSGGGCQSDNLPNLTLPFVSSGYPFYEIVNNAYSIMPKRSNFYLLNVTYMTAQRNDGHPSKFYHNMIPYIQSGKTLPKTQDCLHWCLPGVPDVWNELLFAEFLKNDPL